MAETTKEERTEYLSIRVTKSVKKEFDNANTNKEIQEGIIRRFIQSETEWLESELKEIDEATIKYQAKLIGIKDAFSEKHNAYAEEIDKIYDGGRKLLSKLDGITINLDSKVEKSLRNVKELNTKIGYINTHNLEKFIELAERFEALSSDQQGLVSTLLSSGK